MDSDGDKNGSLEAEKSESEIAKAKFFAKKLAYRDRIASPSTYAADSLLSSWQEGPAGIRSARDGAHR
jgi:hypothetical protein